MRRAGLLLVLLCTLLACFAALPASAATLETFATMDVRPGNPAVGPDGSVYTTVHPLISPAVKLVRIDKNGVATPYPNPVWSRAPGIGVMASIGLVNPLGVQVTRDGALYILDMGSAAFSPKLVVWDTNQNALAAVYYLPLSASTSNSFHQDFALDLKRRKAYIADMGRAAFNQPEFPAIVVVDLETGQVTRRLSGHHFLTASHSEADGGMVVDGEPMMVGGERVSLGLNPISMDPQFRHVYFSTMNAGHIYRISADVLVDQDIWDTDLAKLVEVYGPKPTSDGITVDALGNVYVTDVENNAIGVTTLGNYRMLIQDESLSWPDGLSCGPDGYIYATVNQLHKAPAFNAGEELGTPPYSIVRFKSLGPCTVGR